MPNANARVVPHGGSPVDRVVVSLICLLLLVVSGSPAAIQQVDRGRDLPSVGREVEESLARGESHEWQIDAASAEFLVITVEPLAAAETDEWPSITVTSPDGRTAYESTEPSIAPGIDASARTVVSFRTDRPGLHRLRITARGSPTRYLLRLDERRLAVDQDRERLDAHRLWREGMRASGDGAPESLRASIAKFDEALKVLTALDDREGQAITLSTIAGVWYRLSDAGKGKEAATRALDLWTSLGREREEAIALSDLGLLAYLAYDYPTARANYDQALAKHRATGDERSEARTLTRMGWAYYAAADLQKVIDTSQQALLLYRAKNDPTGESITLNDMGRAYLDLGEIPQAVETLRQALALRPPDRYPRGAANVLIRTGLVYLSVAEWQQALDVLQQARGLAQRVHDTRTEITTLVNLGSAYVTFGDTGEGARHLEAALASARTIAFRGAEAYSLLWLGIGASLDGDLARSRDYLQQAIAIQTAIKDVRGQATTMRQLATVQLHLGAPLDALQSVTKSIEVSPPASGLIYTGSLTLANIYAGLGLLDKARAQYQEAIDRFRQIRARHAESLALTQYARYEALHRRYPEAREMLGQALDIHESLRGLIVDPDLRMSYGGASVTPYQLFVDLLMAMDGGTPGKGFAAEAFHTNERARARGLVEMLARSGVDIREGVDKALVERERSLRWNLNRKAAIQTTLLAGKRDERRLAAIETEIAELSRSLRETTTLIRQQSPAYASLTEPEPLTVSDVSQMLDADTVLLSYAPGEKLTWLFAITRDSFQSFQLRALRQDVERTAREVHDLLTSRQPVRGETVGQRQARVLRADGTLAERSRALSDVLLGPISEKLAGEWRGRRLAIVAGGALEYVPFAMLPVAGVFRPSPLVANHEIVILPSASSLAVLRQATRPTAPKMVAVFADPVFAADDPRVRPKSRAGKVPAATDATRGVATGDLPQDRSLATRAFEPFVGDGARASLERLPFSRAEAAAVTSQVPRSALLEATDFDATLALATSGQLNAYRIIHFATHGFINTTRPELSGLALSLVDAEGRRRDGFLRLNTIYNLRLSADLVVLSACQTALGKEVAGEGLVGLTRGFMHAGARRVIASLWQVNDAATAELMKKFYVNLLRRRLPPGAALRRAQLEMSQDARWSAPYYWAGFVLQGDWK